MLKNVLVKYGYILKYRLFFKKINIIMVSLFRKYSKFFYVFSGFDIL